MNTRRNIYREIKRLPDKAMSVSEYAERENIESCQVYKRWKKQQGERVYKLKNVPERFEIVIFRGHNFVIPARPLKEKTTD